ncbi:MAG: caspase family protein [Putridiphycobacter sp.]
MKKYVFTIKFLALILLFVTSTVGFSQLELVLQTGNNGLIQNLDFSGNQKFLLSGDAKRIVIWDLQQRKQFSSIESENYGAGFLNDSTLFIQQKNKVKIWDFMGSTFVDSLVFSEELKSVQSNSNSLFVLGRNLYQYAINQPVDTLKIDVEQAQTFQLSESGASIGVVKTDTYQIFDRVTQNKKVSIPIENYVTSSISDSLNKVSIAENPACIKTYGFGTRKYYTQNVITNDRSWNNFEAICLSNNYGISGDLKDVITVYDTHKGKILFRKKNDSKIVSKIAINSNHSLIAIAGSEGLINLYGPSVNKIHTFKPISPIATSACLLKDSVHVLIGYNNGQIKKWNYLTHEIHELNQQKSKKELIKKQLNVKDLSLEGGVMEKTWKSSISNGHKREEYRIVFNSDYTQFELEKIKDFRMAPATKSSKDILEKMHLPHGEDISFVSDFLLEGNHLVGSTNGFIYVVDDSGEIKLKMVSPAKNAFFYSTSDNYYYASKSALKLIGAKYKSKLIGFEQIDLLLNRPDKVLPLLSSKFDKEYVKLLEKAYHKRLTKLNVKPQSINQIMEMPVVKTNLSNLPLKTNDQKVKFKIQVTSASPLKAVHVLINDVPIFGKTGKQVSSNNYENEIELDLSVGENTIQVFAENTNGLKSLREKALINCEYIYQPKLFVLAMGSGQFVEDNYNLDYAAKDAEDMANLFSNSKQFSEVEVSTLTNNLVTKQRVFDEINALKEVNINDVVVVFFAGHGVLDANLDYYLSTYNMSFSNPNKNGISYDELENELSKLKCRNKLLLIDACHSGELDKEEVVATTSTTESEDETLTFRAGTSEVSYVGGKSVFELSKNLFADLRSNSGVITISSAGAAEYALEGGKWKNGAFTYCLLKGILDKNADFDKDKKITTNELQRYLFIEVPKLTNGQQTPTSRVELLEQNFVIW